MTLEERVKRLETFIDRIANAFSLCASDGILMPIPSTSDPVFVHTQPETQQTTSVQSVIDDYDYEVAANSGRLMDHIRTQMKNCSTRRELDSIGEIIRVHHFRNDIDDLSRDELRVEWIERQAAIFPGKKGVKK